jgi:hypothetical protein
VKKKEDIYEQTQETLTLKRNPQVSCKCLVDMVLRTLSHLFDQMPVPQSSCMSFSSVKFFLVKEKQLQRCTQADGLFNVRPLVLRLTRPADYFQME